MSSDALSDVGVNLIDVNKPELGLRLNFTGGNMCNATHKYSLIVQLNCEENAAGISYEMDTASI